MLHGCYFFWKTDDGKAHWLASAIPPCVGMTKQGLNCLWRGKFAAYFKISFRKSGYKKPTTLHWLHYSFATHLLENGTALRYIQELLGHTTSKTTKIYKHGSIKSLRQIKSPFDDL